MRKTLVIVIELVFILMLFVGANIRIDELSPGGPPPGATPELTKAGIIATFFAFTAFNAGLFLASKEVDK